jgi:hypothetical protein
VRTLATHTMIALTDDRASADRGKIRISCRTDGDMLGSLFVVVLNTRLRSANYLYQLPFLHPTVLCARAAEDSSACSCILQGWPEQITTVTIATPSVAMTGHTKSIFFPFLVCADCFDGVSWGPSLKRAVITSTRAPRA